MPRKLRDTGSVLVTTTFHIPQYMLDAIKELIRQGVAPSVGEFIRHAVAEMIQSRELCPPPPMWKRRGERAMLISFNLPRAVYEKAWELLRGGVYRSMSDIYRAAIWRKLNGGCAPAHVEEGVEEEAEDGVELLAGRPTGRVDAMPVPYTPPSPPTSGEGVIIVPADEARWDASTWARLYPCAKLLLLRRPVNCSRLNGHIVCEEGWESYYSIDVKCARERDVERL